MWTRASYSTRQDILLLVELMASPEKWDAAQKLADALHTELLERKNSRPDQDLLELFFTKLYPQWEAARMDCERTMLLTASKKFKQLPADEQGRRRDLALQNNTSHLDTMHVPVLISNQLSALMGKMRALGLNEHFNANQQPRLMLAAAQKEADDGVIDRHFMD